MRISVRKDDPGFHPKAMQCTIFVDGVDVTNRCYTADEEQGKAWCFKHNKENRPFLDPDTPNKVAAEVLTGKVVIILLKNRMNGYDPHPCN